MHVLTNPLISPTRKRRRWALLWLAMLFIAARTLVRADPSGGIAGGSVAGTEAAVRATNQLGIAIYRQLGSTKNSADNVVISPVSLATAISLLGTGAGGDTAVEFTCLLHDGTDAAAYDEQFGRLLSTIAPPADAAEAIGERPRNAPDLTIATRLWVGDRIAVSDGFVRTARGDYRAGIESFDETSPQATSDTINAWVSEATAGRIPKIIDSAAVQGASVLLINAVSMKAGWSMPFFPERTADKVFQVTPRKAVEVPMMEQRATLRHAHIQGSGFDLGILELPYDGSLRMLILLPQGNTTLEAVVNRLSSDVLREWSAALRWNKVTASIPRFRIETRSTDMIPLLRNLGLTTIADEGKADFSRLASQRIAVDLVRHTAMIAVDENGTEAAAVTDSGMRVVSAIEAPPVEFRANRPFLFIVDDRSTGAILFLGRLARP